MNCATHNDTAAVAFCRTCGKPLCANCTRDVRGVVYCEPCLAARLEGHAPAAGFVAPPQAELSAGWIAGTIAVHRLRSESDSCRHSRRILSLRRGRSLLLAIRQGTGTSADFWIADFRLRSCRKFGFRIRHRHRFLLRLPDHRCRAHRPSLQEGQPAPDPFGLGQAFSMGEKGESKNIPAVAVDPDWTWACSSCCTP